MDLLVGDYNVNSATWFWLSSLLLIALFFRFSRFWSLRNLDLLLLVLISPGLVLINGQEQERGYVWLFAVMGVILVRLCIDPVFQRRPRLEPNLNRQGLIFLCVALSGFLVTKVFTEPPPDATVETVRSADQMIKLEDAGAGESAQTGPTPSLIAAVSLTLSNGIELVAARSLAILAHIAVVLGLLTVGKRLMRDAQLGLAMATLYLILPCTAFDVQSANHVLPAALIIWAFVFHGRPMVAGTLMGLACGSLFFPIFLLPLWLSIYDGKGALRFGLALLLVSAALLSSLVLTSADTYSFTRQTIGSIDWSVLQFRSETAEGFWQIHDAAWAIPVFCAFVIMLIVLTFFPRKKNLEHLFARSTAIIIATQFWYPQQGGVYVLWYLPLLLIVIYRPRLSHLPLPPEPATTAKSESPTRNGTTVPAKDTGKLPLQPSERTSL